MKWFYLNVALTYLTVSFASAMLTGLCHLLREGPLIAALPVIAAADPARLARPATEKNSLIPLNS